MTEWAEQRLGDVADLLVGFAFPSARFSDDGDFRLLRGVNVSQGDIDWSSCARWAEGLGDKLAKYQLEPGDVILAMDRPWVEAGLKRARINDHDVPALLVQRVARLRGTDLASTGFIHHVIASRRFSDYLVSVASGSTIPHISADQISAFLLALPPIEVQGRIADVLTAFDELIENSRRRIEILEEAARSLYREWFVRLRFPGHESATFVDSTLGPIPEGWSVGSLGDHLDIVMGQSPASKHYNDGDVGLPLHQGVGTYGRRYPEHSRYSDKWNREAAEGDILVSVRAPVGRLNIADRRLALGRGVSAVRPHNGLSAFWFESLRHVFRSEDSFGGGTIFKAVTRADLLGIKCIVPDLVVCRSAEELLRPIAHLDRLLDEQTQALTTARDLLLPRLVTGRIDVDSLGVDDVFGWAELTAAS